MKRKELFLLYMISATFYALITLFIRVPGYMDADYYYAGGIQIATGNGGAEPYIWNYLNPQDSLPAPSFSYWMPFTSVLAATGMKLVGTTAFSAARLFFVLLAGLIPVLSAAVAERFLPGRRAGWIAGSIAMVSTYYLPYLTVTDTMTPFMVFGGIFILLLEKVHSENEKPLKRNWWQYVGLGLVTGVMHLLRADGLIWLVLCLLILSLTGSAHLTIKNFLQKIIFPCLLVTGSYLAVMSPWFLRNIHYFNSVLPPGNGKMLFATGYDDIFFFDTSVLTAGRFLSQGFGEIITDRLYSLWMNFKSLLLVNGGIILVPMILVASWSQKKSFIIKILYGLVLMNLVIMSIAFPYAGYRGGFFHSNSSIQTVLWGLVPFGLDRIIRFGILHRGWKLERAWRLFSITVIVICFAISGFIFTSKLFSSVEDRTGWNQTLTQYKEIDQEIIRLSGDKDSVIMVNNPPGFYLATKRKAIINPTDGMENLLLAAKMYHARFFILDSNNARLNEDLSLAFPKGVELLTQVGDSKLYEIYE